MRDFWAIVLPGIRVGTDVTVAVGSVVRHDLSNGAFAAGNPAVVKQSKPHTFADPTGELAAGRCA